MILGHGANTMTLEQARLKLCAQAKLLGKECNPGLLTGQIQHHYGHDDVAAQQSKDAMIYVTIVVVFYVAIVLLLIGTNLRAGRAGRAARFKKHVVEFSEGSGKAENRLVPQRSSSSPCSLAAVSAGGARPGSAEALAAATSGATSDYYYDEDVADV